MTTSFRKIILIGCLQFSLAGCSEKSKNILIGNDHFKIIAPSNLCLSVIGYPLSDSQLNEFKYLSDTEISIYAIYRECDAISNKVAMIGVEKGAINLKFSDRADQFALYIKNKLSSLKKEEIEGAEKIWEKALKKNARVIKRATASDIENLESDNLAVYFERTATVELTFGAQNMVKVAQAMTMINGKPFILFLVDEETGHSKTLRESLKEWVIDMHGIN